MVLDRFSQYRKKRVARSPLADFCGLGVLKDSGNLHIINLAFLDDAVFSGRAL